MEIAVCILMICLYLVSMGKIWEMDRRVSWVEDMMITCTEEDDDGEEEEK